MHDLAKKLWFPALLLKVLLHANFISFKKLLLVHLSQFFHVLYRHRSLVVVFTLLQEGFQEEIKEEKPFEVYHTAQELAKAWSFQSAPSPPQFSCYRSLGQTFSSFKPQPVGEYPLQECLTEEILDKSLGMQSRNLWIALQSLIWHLKGAQTCWTLPVCFQNCCWISSWDPTGCKSWQPWPQGTRAAPH